MADTSAGKRKKAPKEKSKKKAKTSKVSLIRCGRVGVWSSWIELLRQDPARIWNDGTHGMGEYRGTPLVWLEHGPSLSIRLS